jgi:superfamily II DNA helicase RecQ
MTIYLDSRDSYDRTESSRNKYLEQAFRPAYGRLGEFRAILPEGIPFLALSATFAPHIRQVVQRELIMSPDHVTITLSINRPNITYATTPITGNLRNLSNFDRLIPINFHPPMEIPKTLIFHDCKQDATDAARYVNARLPKHLQNQGIVKHYHSDMSVQYLQHTYEDFSDPGGRRRILHVTAGASTVSEMLSLDMYLIDTGS